MLLGPIDVGVSGTAGNHRPHDGGLQGVGLGELHHANDFLHPHPVQGGKQFPGEDARLPGQVVSVPVLKDYIKGEFEGPGVFAPDYFGQLGEFNLFDGFTTP